SPLGDRPIRIRGEIDGLARAPSVRGGGGRPPGPLRLRPLSRRARAREEPPPRSRTEPARRRRSPGGPVLPGAVRREAPPQRAVFRRGHRPFGGPCATHPARRPERALVQATSGQDQRPPPPKEGAPAHLALSRRAPAEGSGRGALHPSPGRARVA